MAKKYTKRELELRECIERKEIEIVMCPDCGFEYSALHSSDGIVPTYECPLCELEEKDEAINDVINRLMDIKES